MVGPDAGGALLLSGRQAWRLARFAEVVRLHAVKEARENGRAEVAAELLEVLAALEAAGESYAAWERSLRVLLGAAEGALGDSAGPGSQVLTEVGTSLDGAVSSAAASGQWFTTSEAAGVMKVSERAVRAAVERGALVSRRSGRGRGVLLVESSSVAAYVARREQTRSA